MLFKFMITLVLSSALISCATESDTEEQTGIDGRWLWPCIQLSGQSSYIITEEYDAGNYTGTVQGFATSDCSGGEQASYVGTGTYSVGDSFTTENTPAITADEVDFVIANVATTGDAGLIAEIENYYTWQTNSNLYDIVFVDDESDKLYFADYSSGDGLTEATRATKIDLSISASRLGDGS